MRYFIGGLLGVVAGIWIVTFAFQNVRFGETWWAFPLAISCLVFVLICGVIGAALLERL